MTRIALYEPYVFDSAYGNLKYLQGLFQHLDRERFSPVLVSPMASDYLERIHRVGGETKVIEPPERLRRFGGRLLHSGMLSRAATAATILQHSRTLSQFFRRERIELVQCQNIRGLLMTALAARRVGAKTIWYIKRHLDNPLLDRVGFHLADRVLYQDQTNMARRYPHLVERFSEKIRVVPNGVDLTEIDRVRAQDHQLLRRELRIREGQISVVFLGQIFPVKCPHLVIDAMEAITARFPNTKLYLVGDHCNAENRAYHEGLRQRVQERRLDGIHFTGFRRDAIAILSQMDILVLPSLDEGIPRAIMEAMALGKAVVATPVGGIPELIRDRETGLSVPTGDVGALSRALTELVDNPQLRADLGRNASSLIHDRYSLTSSVSTLMQVYDELLPTRSTGIQPTAARSAA